MSKSHESGTDPRQRSAETKRNQTQMSLVSAAAQNFYMNGYNGTTVPDICIDAKVSRATLYNHFDSKVELGHAVLEATFKTITSTEAFRSTGGGFVSTLHALKETVDLYPEIGMSLWGNIERPRKSNESILISDFVPGIHRKLRSTAEAENLGIHNNLTAETIAEYALETVAVHPLFGDTPTSARLEMFLASTQIPH